MSSTRFRGRRFALLAVAVMALAGACASLAIGDQLRSNAVDSSANGVGGNLQRTLNAEGVATAQVGYYIAALGNDCDVDEDNPVSVTITPPPGVVATPRELTFEECEDEDADGNKTGRQMVTFCATEEGQHDIPNAGLAGNEDVDSLNNGFKLTVSGDEVEDASCGGTGGDEVLNTAPTVSTEAPDPATAPEGSGLTTSGAFSDSDIGDTLTITKLAGAGSVTPGSGGTWSWSHSPNDNFASQSVVVKATDAGGLSVTDTFVWSSTNVAPTPENLVVSGSDCRPTVTFDIDDPGSGDRWAFAAGWDGESATNVLALIAAWDPAAGAPNASYANDQTELTLTKPTVYSSTGTKTIRVAAKDDDGGEGTETTPHEIPNTVAQAQFGPPVQLDGNGKGLFKAGSTIPVKVRAGACAFESDGSYTPVSGANLRVLNLAYVGPDVTGTPVTVTSNVKANAEGWMRESSGQYIYNLQLPKTARGTYTLAIQGYDESRANVTGIVAQKNIAIR